MCVSSSMLNIVRERFVHCLQLAQCALLCPVSFSLPYSFSPGSGTTIAIRMVDPDSVANGPSLHGESFL